MIKSNTIKHCYLFSYMVYNTPSIIEKNLFLLFSNCIFLETCYIFLFSVTLSNNIFTCYDTFRFIGDKTQIHMKYIGCTRTSHIKMKLVINTFLSVIIYFILLWYTLVPYIKYYNPINVKTSCIYNRYPLPTSNYYY